MATIILATFTRLRSYGESSTESKYCKTKRASGFPSQTGYMIWLFLLLTIEQKKELFESFTSQDVITTLKAMAALKYPGPDGYHAYFFQQYWMLASEAICETVLDILRERRCLSGSMIPFYPSYRRSITCKESRSSDQQDYAMWYTNWLPSASSID